ncbi:MAG: hypothetical protein PHO66_05480 [Eubacteriales bacterium]|nr:hypothetical protein [Eubacteriales bacterium]
MPIGITRSTSVEVSGGTPPYTYTWQEDEQRMWQDMTGTSQASVRDNTILIVKPDSKNSWVYNSNFRCKITDSAGASVTTNVIAITAPFTIFKQPTRKSLAAGESSAFTVEVYGGKKPYAFVWQRLSRGTWQNIVDSGTAWNARTSSLAITITLKPDDSWLYNEIIRCKITDASGTTLYTDDVICQYRD